MTPEKLEDPAIDELDPDDAVDLELDADDADDADDAQSDAAEAPTDVEDVPPRRLHLGLAAVAVLLLVAAVFTWWRATNHDADMVGQAELRDTVLITATSAIETMNTLDHREVDAGLESWAEVTTGTLHDQVVATSEEDKQLLADQQKVSSGKVVDAAVVDLTESSATVIAAVEVTVRDDADPEAEPTVKRNRFAADLVKVGDEWLLETLEQVAVNLS